MAKIVSREKGKASAALADKIKMERVDGGGVGCVKQSRGFPFGASGGVRSTGIPQIHYARKRRSGAATMAFFCFVFNSLASSPRTVFELE